MLIANSLVSAGICRFSCGQHPGAHLAVEREHRDAVAHGQHQRASAGRRRSSRPRPGGGRAAGSRPRSRRGGGPTLRSTEKMVPMLTLTSMLLRAVERVEQQQVLALRVAVGHDVDACPSPRWPCAARWPPHSLASISTSLEMMSSFFWISPCTFSVSAVPSTSPSAPLLTEMAMRLQARATTSISSRSWPGMRPCSRCCSTRYWVRLMRLAHGSVLQRAA